MALGGGKFLFKNKILPGAYTNVVSRSHAASLIAGRGIGTIPLELDWGIAGDVFRVEKGEFEKYTQKIFGYDYGHPKMKPLRDLFKNLRTGYFYRLNSDGEKATCKYGTAKYPGVRGNDLTVVIKDSIDEPGKKIVSTYITTNDVLKIVDKQVISKKEELVDNDYIIFNKSQELQTESVKLQSGTNGSAVQVSDYQKYLEAIEPYFFNSMGYAGKDDTIKNLLISFCKRMRDDVGSKFVLYVHDKEGINYEGVVCVKNDVKDDAVKGSLVYWLVGASASCEMNEALTNRTYDGEYEVNTSYKQYELKQAIINGMLIFHNEADSVSGDIKGKTKVLKDINTYTDFSKDKDRNFSLNQVVRIMDNAAIDIARIFNLWYLGKRQNFEIGRVDLWKDLRKTFDDYAQINAIQPVTEKDFPVPQQGDNKEDVVVELNLTPIVVMEKLYSTVYVV